MTLPPNARNYLTIGNKGHREHSIPPVRKVLNWIRWNSVYEEDEPAMPTPYQHWISAFVVVTELSFTRILPSSPMPSPARDD